MERHKGFEDIAGRKYGKLTVLVPTDQRNKQRQRLWRCVCDCGGERLCSAQWLKLGWAKSCGCREPKVDVTGMRFGHSVALRPTDKRGSDRSVVWECRCDCGNLFYRTAARLRRGGDKASCGCMSAGVNQLVLKLHFVNGTVIERLESHKPTISNTSGVRGVYFDPEREKWVASIGFQGRQYPLGRFDTLEEAADARTRAEESLYRPFLEAYYAGRLEAEQNAVSRKTL